MAKFVIIEIFLYLCHHIQINDIVYDEEKVIYFIDIDILLRSFQSSCREQDGLAAAQDDQFGTSEGKKPRQGVVGVKEHYRYGGTEERSSSSS